MSRRATLALLLGLATGCAAGGKLRADAEVARADIAKARASGAMRCAPRDLALAEANVEFAEKETATGHGARAREHLDASEASVKRALELSRGCGPTQVTIAKREEKPVVRIEKTDTDKDGVPDVDDRCPEIPGPAETGGCPPVAKDSDSDGLPDDIDRCPLDPEDRDGFQDEDGCPDPDNDGDGIVDKADACPLEAGPMETRGCPVKDRDGDGVSDLADACPDVAGLKVLAGCPDSDSDGLADAEDKCPQQAGTKENGGCPDVDTDGDTIADRLDKCPSQFGPPPDGCPKKYTLVEVKREKIDIKQQVHFATAKFRVLPDSFPLLNQVVQVLRDFSNMRISIEGHTDAVGTEAANMKLSQRRSEAVLDYLISKGISPERLEAVGYGPTKPIASNKTVTGRARNRRTEFRIVAVE
ncbi:OmpA family protein [Anaeromyxobacter terrae]|uniref:OmpA family protein n=1 Tax=Anaeromyxobacter terrae TaxID=2925406 RepID=UPI001F575A81|nr:OmpA family protein [Anaeromyxobacter sp. SG22]